MAANWAQEKASGPGNGLSPLLNLIRLQYSSTLWGAGTKREKESSILSNQFVLQQAMAAESLKATSDERCTANSRDSYIPNLSSSTGALHASHLGDC